MMRITLYTGGGVSLSPVFAEGRTESNYVRLVADDDMMLQKGEIASVCVDVLKTEVADWQEVEYTEDPEIDDAEAFSIIFGGAE